MSFDDMDFVKIDLHLCTKQLRCVKGLKVVDLSIVPKNVAANTCNTL